VDLSTWTAEHWVSVLALASMTVRAAFWYLDRRDARAKGGTPPDESPPV
jgi:hypothetical protein